MKRVCLLLLISVAAITMGQTPDSVDQKSFHPQLIPNSATAKKVARHVDSARIDSAYPKEREPQIREDASGNANAILQWQKEQRAKQKRNALIRIGIGVFFLIVLVIGVRRNLKSR